jgi:stage V sporulation protein D (sporulation-specific penicillin-binding protein)
MGFLPADNPQVVVYIAVDNAKGVSQYGGTVAAPIAKTVMQSAIETLNIEKRENELEREFSILDKQYKEVPNVVGMNVEEAVKLLKDFKVEFTGSGSTVIYQSPSPSTNIYEGETVRLMLSDN